MGQPYHKTRILEQMQHCGGRRFRVDGRGLPAVAIIDFENWGDTAGPRKKQWANHKCLSCMVIIRCFED